MKHAKRELKTKDYIKEASTESALQPRTLSGTKYSRRSSHQTLTYHSGSQRA
jgi:hypothetical protein